MGKTKLKIVLFWTPPPNSLFLEQHLFVIYRELTRKNLDPFLPLLQMGFKIPEQDGYPTCVMFLGQGRPKI
jgi:hypothetical protein